MAREAIQKLLLQKEESNPVSAFIIE